MRKITFPVLLIILIISVTSGISSCYYDKEEILYPNTICDTTSITYSQSVAPLLSSLCNSCHGGNIPSSGIKLDTYADLKTQAINGRLWGAVSHSPNYQPMPQNAPKLNDCNLSVLKKWLDAGAPNN